MTNDKINRTIGSRANCDDSDQTVIPWRKHEIFVAACVVVGFVAMLAFTAGVMVGRP